MPKLPNPILTFGFSFKWINKTRGSARVQDKADNYKNVQTDLRDRNDKTLAPREIAIASEAHRNMSLPVGKLQLKETSDIFVEIKDHKEYPEELIAKAMAIKKVFRDEKMEYLLGFVSKYSSLTLIELFEAYFDEISCKRTSGPYFPNYSY